MLRFSNIVMRARNKILLKRKKVLRTRNFYCILYYRQAQKWGEELNNKIERAAIRLNENELKKAAIDYNLETNGQIAEAIGVSVTQLWRATLPVGDSRYNAPGENFIAGVLTVFGGPFERFFFLDKNVANATKQELII